MNKISFSILYASLIGINLLCFLFGGQFWLNMYAIGFLSGLWCVVLIHK